MSQDWNAPPPPPPPPGPRPRPSSHQPPPSPWWKRLWVVAVGALVIGVIIGAAAGTGAKSTSAGKTTIRTATATDTATVNATVTATPTIVKVVKTRTHTETTTYTPPPKHTFTDGKYKVGPDIPSGDYRTDGGSQCYYEIDSDPDGQNIVDNNNFSGPERVSVSHGQYLSVEGGCEWRQA